MLRSVAAVAWACALGVAALVPRDGTCCFHLTASGGVSGGVGQLGDGQNRVGGSFPQGKYCINGQGAITDGQGRGCFFTPPTSQFQCDVGAQPATGFVVGCDGTLSTNGDYQFFACPTGDQGSYNIYTRSIQSACVPITLTADGCKAGCLPPPPPPPPSASPPSIPACPTAFTGPYEFPHLIIPVNSASPNQAYGNSFNGQVTSTISSIFNFDIPPSAFGKVCQLVFLFPTQSQLQTSSFTFSGSGGIDFSQLTGNADTSTTYSNAPSVATDFGVTTVAPGHSYLITVFACPAGQRISFELKGSGDTSLTYFQDSNPAPIGLYVAVC